MTDRSFAVVLMLLFAIFFYDASSDIVGLVASRAYGAVPLLLFCAIACVGWIAFLAALAMASAPARGLNWHDLKSHWRLPHA